MTLTTITRSGGYDVLDGDTKVGRIVPTAGVFQWATVGQPVFAGGEVATLRDALAALTEAVSA